MTCDVYHLESLPERGPHGALSKIAVQFDFSLEHPDLARLSSDNAREFGRDRRQRRFALIRLGDSETSRPPIPIGTLLEPRVANRREHRKREFLDQVLPAVKQGGKRKITQSAVQ